MALAYSYKRFSTPDQAKGDSARRQDARFSELCAKHGLTPATTYFDEGKSGWKAGKQRDLQKFLDLVQSGKVQRGSWLALESLDRLSRQGFRKTQKLLEAIIEGGVTVATTSPERVLDEKSLDDPLATVEILLIASRAKEESDRKSERVKSAWNGKLSIAKADGIVATNRGPAWIQWVASDKGSRVRITKKVNERGDWKLLPERVKVVKQIFDWATINGLGHRAIAKRLNADKIPAFKTHWRSGNKWGWAYVALILTDRRVIGEFKSKVGVIPDYYPAVIDEGTFLKAQSLIKKRVRFRGKTSDRIANLFTGLAVDKDTGSNMVYVKKGKDIEARWIPAVFETTSKSGHPHKAISFNYDIFENVFLAFTKELTLDEIGNSPNPDDSREDSQLEVKLAKLEVQIEAIKSSLISLADNPAELVEALATASKSRKEVVAKLEAIRAAKHLALPKDALAESKSIIEKLENVKGQALVDLRSQLRQSIRNLVSRIDVHLHRKGWITDCIAFITFSTGFRRIIAIKTIRGKLEAVATNAKEWKADGDFPKELLVG